VVATTFDLTADGAGSANHGGEAMTRLRRWSWLGLCALAVISGCNLYALPYFLAGHDPRDEAKWHSLASKNKDTEVQVAVLVASNLPMHEQLARVDRELCQKFIAHLNQLCKANEEKVQALPMNKVQHYLDSHPGWDRPLDLVKIGRELHVKYVIYLELNKLTLYEPNSNLMFYHGETEIKITLVNARKGSDEMPDTMEFHESYPSTPITTFDDPNPIGFRDKFVHHIAERLAWQFTEHPVERGFAAD
jgi:hypothetical protein